MRKKNKKMSPDEEWAASFKDFKRDAKSEGIIVHDMHELDAGVDPDFDDETSDPGRPYEPQYTSEQDWRG